MKLLLLLFVKVFRRECLIQLRQIRYLINFCLFLLIVLFIFPLTLRPEVLYLKSIAPGLVWVAVLLALLVSSERLFLADQEQAVIEQWLISSHSMTLLVSAKVFAHWLLTLIPVVILSPVIALLFSLSLWETWVLFLSFLCGSPALLFLCAFASCFGMVVGQRGALMALILLPLSLPILIFGSGTVNIAMEGLPVSGYLSLLLAMSLLSLGFLPLAIAAVIRIGYAD